MTRQSRTRILRGRERCRASRRRWKEEDKVPSDQNTARTTIVVYETLSSTPPFDRASSRERQDSSKLTRPSQRSLKFMKQNMAEVEAEAERRVGGGRPCRPLCRGAGRTARGLQGAARGQPGGLRGAPERMVSGCTVFPRHAGHFQK